MIRRMRAYYIDSIVVIDLDWGKSWVTLYIANVNCPAVHGVAARSQCLEKMILRRTLLTTGGVQSHHLLCEIELPLKTLLHGIENLACQIRRQWFWYSRRIHAVRDLARSRAWSMKHSHPSN